MNIKRILLAVVVLALTVGCAWASTEASAAAGFAVVPDNEAAQIIGGDGWTCTYLEWSAGYAPCGYTEETCSQWYDFFEVWRCESADSGECYESVVVGLRYGNCAWDPEFEVCGRDGTAWDVPVYACN